MGRASVQRGSARAVGLRAALATAALSTVVGIACMETQRSLGEDCLKNDDCLSGICSSLICAAAPPLVGTGPVADAATAVDAGPVVPADASEAESADAAAEAGSDQEAAAEPADATGGADGPPADEGGSVD
jgi:hypothetical protein